jgi:hypothetical protein
MLARNPTDNHGWRDSLRRMLLRRGDAAGALVLLDAYPDDAPPAGHDRALALYLASRTQEAEAALREAHAAWPAFVAALLPEALDRPASEGEGLLAVGGALQAWHWRADLREVWVRSGALDWLRTLALPQEPAARRKKRAAARGGMARPKAAAASRTQATPSANLEVLRRHYGERLPWLLGFLVANAWAPRFVTPTAWVGTAIEHAAGTDSPAGMEALLAALMDQYNAFNEQRLAAALDAPVPLPEFLPADDDAAWTVFAAGFLEAVEKHGVAPWRAAGASVTSANGPFRHLYQLAARAPVGPQGWRAADEAGQPLLVLAGDTPPARTLLAHALQPLWLLALAARD